MMSQADQAESGHRGSHGAGLAVVEISRLSRTPTVYDQEDTEDPSVDRIVGLLRDAGCLQGDRPGRGQDVTVLITGESGTGKELVARAIYQHSRRNRKPFLADQLRGHSGDAAGKRTVRPRERRVHRRRAPPHRQVRAVPTGGTIFLDEIGDMPLATQAKILRLLQEGQFERVGGNETIATDVRIIAATNRKLEELVAQGAFREDLYYRLKVYAIHLPPLRDRRADLPLLVEHFRQRFNRELGKSIRSVPAEVLELLQAYPGPETSGNCRVPSNSRSSKRPGTS